MKFACFFKYNVLKEKWSYNIKSQQKKKKVCKYNFLIRKGSVRGRAGKQLFSTFLKTDINLKPFWCTHTHNHPTFMPSLHMFINKIIETLVSKQIEDDFVQEKKKKTNPKSKPKKAPSWTENTVCSCL